MTDTTTDDRQPTDDPADDPATEFYSVGAHSDSSVFHTDTNCRMVNSSRHLQERSQAYVEWHDLTECEYCAGIRGPAGGDR